MIRLLSALAAFALATGVALSAYAAHAGGETRLATASQFLMIQGAALLAGAAVLRQSGGRLAALALMATLAGTALFCGDLVLRGMELGRLFPMAAPLGGLLMIGGWALFGATMLIGRGR
jgi:uncharacterized membrane protein YgdD (TMEM256/DUF423 family)